MKRQKTIITCACGTVGPSLKGRCRACNRRAYYLEHKEEIERKRKRGIALVRSYVTTEVATNGMDAKNAGLPVKVMSLMALSAARTAERRVTELMRHLGLNAPALPTDAGSIIILIEDLLKPIQYAFAISPNYLRYWGGVFFGLDLLYLKGVGILLESKEPWKVFCDFANRLSYLLNTEGAEALKKSEDLQLAAKYFSAAKGHLWQVSYLFCRSEYNSKIATDIFGGKTRASSELYALLCNDQP